MTHVLEVENVEQSFKVGFWMESVEVLHRISLKVPERSVYGFLGANGAGKTTLIHLMVGLRKPTSGKVTVYGHNSLSTQAKARIGYLPERPYFHDHLTGEELLKYFGALSGLKRQDLLIRIPKVLSLVGLTAAKNLQLRKYSKGMLQRIGIAQALIHNPDLLILDEPMSGLDPVGRKEIRELMVQLSLEGKTLFFSTHVIPDVEAICDQVALIQKGRLISSGPIDDLLSYDKDEFEVVFEAKKSLEELQSVGFQSVRALSNGYRGMVSGQQNLQTTLSKLLAQNPAKNTDGGTKILSVLPVRPSLEDYLVGEQKK